MKWSVSRVEPGVMPLTDYVQAVIQMVAARVPRCKGHHFVQLANQQFPFVYRHLKRTRPENDDLLILLTPSSESIESQLEGSIDYRIVSVPRYAPSSREQYEAGSALWPMIFHENRKEQVKLQYDDLIESLVNDHFDKFTKDHPVAILTPSGTLIAHGDRDHTHPLGHPCFTAIKNAALQVQPPAYLCTDMVVFCKDEPCLMCAMALLHSRIGAIVFESGRDTDSPYSHPINLQSLGGLNHYYKVYHARCNKSIV